MHLLQVADLGKFIREGINLEGISFVQEAFQNIAIAGASGSGKTTLLKLIGGLAQPDQGMILFKGEKVKGPLDKLIPGHPGIAYLSQHFELWPHYTVEEILSYANQLSESRTKNLIEICRIGHLLQRKTDQLSGGEKQRIALARLLLTAPRLLLLDEPYSNLDLIHKQELKAVVHDIGEMLKISCILVSHDPLDLLSWAERLLILREGRLVQQGSPEEIYRHPVDVYAGGLLGTYSLIGPELAAKLFKLPAKREADGKKLFIRPGDLEIVKGGNQSHTGPVGHAAHASKGIVRKVRFLGMVYAVEVVVGDEVMIAYTERSDFSEGEKASISLQSSGTWVRPQVN